MNGLYSALPKYDAIPLALRALFERRGYKKYRMDAFEPYDVYRENKNFLTSGGILTFTGAGGRLMALKPDVTISIIRSVPEDAVSRKLFYTENVFRPDRGTGEFAEIGQTGLEYIGADTGYGEAEVAALACESLAAIGGEYILSVGHMGLLTALLGEYGLNSSGIIDGFGSKNAAAVAECADAAGLTRERRGNLLAAVSLSLPASEAGKLERFAVNPAAADAVSELKQLAATLTAFGCSDRVTFDLSVVNDTDYYNGIVMRGYIRQAADAVLAGGRYDNMMRRFGKPQSAVGFAIYLGELERALYAAETSDADILLLCGGCSPEVTARAVRSLSSDGSVRAEKDGAGIIAARTIRLSPDGTMTEVRRNA